MITKPQNPAVRALYWAGCLLAAGALLAPCRSAGGTWSAVSSTAPNSVELMMLLPDGTVMAADAYNGGYGNAWYRLTPNSSGSYVNGTWSSRASAAYTRLWCSSQVLRNGKVFVAGGE